VKPVSLGIAPLSTGDWSCIIGPDGAAVNIRCPAGRPERGERLRPGSCSLEQFRSGNGSGTKAQTVCMT
jgi:hypothetical protein